MSTLPVAADEELLRALHDEHADALWSFVCRLNGGDRVRAQDVVQETMLRAWRTPSVLASEPGPARSWLFTVARRIVIDEWRSPRTARETVTDRTPEVATPDRTDAVLDGWVVADALERLSADHRTVIRVCWFGGRTTVEAARELGVPEGTVRSRLHYGLRALRLALQEMGVEA